MREIVVTMTLEESRAEEIAERLRYVNLSRPSASDEALAVWTMEELAEVMGWSTSLTRRALATLYADDRAMMVVNARGQAAWAASRALRLPR